MASVLVYAGAEGHTGPVLEAPADRLAELLEQAGGGTPVVDDGSAGMVLEAPADRLAELG